MPVPRDLDIFSPETVMKPCTKTFFGSLRFENSSIAGQNSVWKYMMSLPMKWYCSTSDEGAMNASNDLFSPFTRALPVSK